MVNASETVIAAVAEKEGVSEEHLTPPLHDAVDPDALDALYEPGPGERDSYPTVQFRYHGYEVVVYGPEEVEVRDSTIGSHS